VQIFNFTYTHEYGYRFLSAKMARFRGILKKRTTMTEVSYRNQLTNFANQAERTLIAYKIIDECVIQDRGMSLATASPRECTWSLV